MQGPGSDDQMVPTVNTPVERPRYTFFANTGKKIGILATKTHFRIREFLHQDIHLPRNIFPHSNNSTTPHNITSHNETPRQGIPAKEAGPELEEDPATKDPEPEKGEDLRNLVARSHETLASITTVFPFTLFPDTLLLDRTKITIIKRNFFFSSEIMSIRIEDILNVTSGIGPFFGSITIASRVLSSEDHFTINYFWRHDAVHMKHLIQGYVIAQHNGIDTKHLERRELLSTLNELGHDSSS